MRILGTEPFVSDPKAEQREFKKMKIDAQKSAKTS